MHKTILLSCLVFAVSLLMLAANAAMMFGDPDTGWHLATGDLIRSSGAIPERDPWSFTAGDKQWLVLSWAWDAAASWLYQHFGWQGVTAMNSITIAAATALIFAAAFIRSRDAIAAFLACMLASMTATINIRPYHVTFLMMAALSLLLSQVSRGKCSRGWLLALPPMMAVWVNGHGGFLMGFFLLGIHGLNAMAQRDMRLTLWLAATGIASLAACLLNPYGLDYFFSILMLFNDDAKPYVSEWAALDFSLSNANLWLYAVAFAVLVMMRRIQAAAWEKWLACAFLLAGLISIRNMPVFAIVSAPLLALGLSDAIMLREPKPRTPPRWVLRLQEVFSRAAGSWRAPSAALAGCAALSLWMFSPQAVSHYALRAMMLPPDLSQEIAFLRSRYPGARMLNSYNLGGGLIFYGRGKVPVFIDGREGTAYPREVVRDYFAFSNSHEDWESILDRYRIDGVLIGRGNDVMIDRLASRRGWHMAFKGKSAVVFMRGGDGK